MRIKNVGEYYATNGFVECSTRGFRWLPIVDEESNRKVCVSCHSFNYSYRVHGPKLR